MHNYDKKAVAKKFDVGYTYIESWLESISYVRNICAHYGRLYNAKLSKTPMLYKEYIFVDNLELLFDKYTCAQISTMGFPDNWKELLEN